MFLGVLSSFLIAVEPPPYWEMSATCASSIAALPQVETPVQGKSLEQLVEVFLQNLNCKYATIIQRLTPGKMQISDSYMKAANALIFPTLQEISEALGFGAAFREADLVLAAEFSVDLGEILWDPSGHELLMKKVDSVRALKNYSKFFIRRALPLGLGDPFLPAQILFSPDAENLRQDFGFTNVRSPSDDGFRLLFPDIDPSASLSGEATEFWNLIKDKPWDHELYTTLRGIAMKVLESLKRDPIRAEAFNAIKNLDDLSRAQAIELLKVGMPPRELAAFLEAHDIAWTQHMLSHEDTLKPIDQAFIKMNQEYNAYERIYEAIEEHQKVIAAESNSPRRRLMEQELKRRIGERDLRAKQFVEAYREAYVYAKLLKHGLEPRSTFAIESDPILVRENRKYEHRVFDEYNSLKLENLEKKGSEGVVEIGSALSRVVSIQTAATSTDPMVHLMRAVGVANTAALRLSQASRPAAAEDIEQQVHFIIRTYYLMNLALVADWKSEKAKIYVDYDAYKKSKESEDGEEYL